MNLKIDVRDAKYLMRIITASNDLEMSNQRLKDLHDLIKEQVKEWEEKHPTNIRKEENQ